MGLQGFFAGANPSCVWVRAGCSLLAHHRALMMAEAAMQGAHRELFGVQYLAQGHFSMQLSSARSWDLNQ